jgi:hypothetical protein
VNKETTGSGVPLPTTYQGSILDQSQTPTLRDYFAASASEGDIKFWMPMGHLVEKVRESYGQKSIYHEPGMFTREQARYRYANAMMEARKK